MGRVFQAFFAKEKTVYLVETGDFERTPTALDWNRKTLLQLIQWHNSLENNPTQVRVKHITNSTKLTNVTRELLNGPPDSRSHCQTRSLRSE